MRFIVDTMLGTLARWLRVFGFDTAYAKDMDDDGIIAAGRNESRTIISSDRELCGRAPGSILIKDAELEKQILYVLESHEPDGSKILTRCLECNALLEPIEKDEVRSMIPDSTRVLHDRFWHCANCRKTYWRGSHYRKMLEEVERLSPQCKS